MNIYDLIKKLFFSILIINYFNMSLNNNFRKLLTYKLRNKYNVKKNFYNVKKINELIFDVTSKYTAKFKEYLLMEDENDFLRRFYNKKELKKKLKGILYFY